jgi:hypothetical protein
LTPTGVDTLRSRASNTTKVYIYVKSHPSQNDDLPFNREKRLISEEKEEEMEEKVELEEELRKKKSKN